MPVLIFERVKTRQYLRIFKRYRRRLLFLGRLDVMAALLMGLGGYWYIIQTKYDPTIRGALMSILASARLENEPFRVVDWFRRKGTFTLLVTREPN